MMSITVIDLNNFYQTPLGNSANQEIHRVIKSLWPKVEKGIVVLIGFTHKGENYTNFHSSQVLHFNPAQQGVLCTSHIEQNHHQILINENSLPLPDASVDRIILLHGLENSHTPSQLLNEITRILKGNGRFLVLTPNRRGLWASSTNTPFGCGHPYTMTQLMMLLNEHAFTPVRSKRCLYTPPFQHPIILKLEPLFTFIGNSLFRKFSGLICVEAIKSVYHPIPMGVRKKSLIWTPPNGKTIKI